MKNTILKITKKDLQPCVLAVKLLLIIVICLITNYNIYGQTNDTLYVNYRVNYKDALALHDGESTDPNGIPGPNYTKDTGLNNLLNKYQIVYYAPYYSKGVLNLSLKNYYAIAIKGDTQNFAVELSKLNLTNGIETLKRATPLSSNLVLDDNNSFKICPNPATEKLFIENNLPQNSNYFITNLLGQEIDSGLLKSEIDISHLLNGVYVLKIVSTNNQIQVLKFIKQ